MDLPASTGIDSGKPIIFPGAIMLIRSTAILSGSVVLLFLLSYVCHSQDFPFEVIDQGGISGIRTGKTLAIRDDATWREIWIQHKRGSTPPAIDFSKQMVIAIFVGERRTGGYSVKIKDITTESGGLRVTYEESRPGRGCMATMAITYPFQIIRLAKFEGPVSFNPTFRAKDCSR